MNLMLNKINKYMNTVTTLLIILCVNATNGQFLQYVDGLMPSVEAVEPFQDTFMLPKASSSIPIIVLLKPRKGRKLEDGFERRSSNTHVDQWMGFNDNNFASIQNVPAVNEKMMQFESQVSSSLASTPSPGLNEDSLPSKAKRKQKISWNFSSNANSKQSNEATFASISSLLPQFAALSQGNAQQLGKLADGVSAGIDAQEVMHKK